MLQLRKILLLNKFFLIIFLITCIITSIRLFLPKHSQYSEESQELIGRVIKIEEKEDYTKLYIKNKEVLLVTINKAPKLELGDQVKIKGSFEKPSKNTTKYLFNYQNYCYQNNIFYVVKGTSVKVQKNLQTFAKKA